MKQLSETMTKLVDPPRRPRPPLGAREARSLLRRHGEHYAPEDVERGVAAARQILRLLTQPSSTS